MHSSIQYPPCSTHTMSVVSKCLLVLTMMASVCLSSSRNAFVSGFCPMSPIQQQQLASNQRKTGLLYETSFDSSSGSEQTETAQLIKRDLLQLGASYDRGYGATKRANDQVESLISKLEACNMETNASRGVEGDGDSPLSGSWRMVWTTAADVLTLSANPLATVGAIYQVFDLPTVTNIIDILPPFQTLAPSMSSVLRAKVTTRAYKTKDTVGESNRIGLEFQKVALEPVQLLGNDVGFLPPLGFDLPRTPFEGYFEVSFLDEELLIIRQNAPGGLFVLAKVDNFDP